MCNEYTHTRLFPLEITMALNWRLHMCILYKGDIMKNRKIKAYHVLRSFTKYWEINFCDKHTVWKRELGSIQSGTEVWSWARSFTSGHSFPMRDDVLPLFHQSAHSLSHSEALIKALRVMIFCSHICKIILHKPQMSASQFTCELYSILCIYTLHVCTHGTQIVSSSYTYLWSHQVPLHLTSVPAIQARD